MKDIELVLDDEHKDKSKEELSKLFDEEIEKFSIYMSTIGDWKSVGPLNQQEKALIKSYIVFKVVDNPKSKDS